MTSKTTPIPESVIDLKEGWCFDIYKLIPVKIDPRNSWYSNYWHKLIKNHDERFFSDNLYDLDYL